MFLNSVCFTFGKAKVLKMRYYELFYYSVVCLTTGPKPLPKRFLHIVRSKASSFK